MKRKLASFLFALSVVGFMTSCEEMNYGEGQLPPLAGEVVFTDVTGTSAARVSPNFVLGVELSNGSGAALEAVFSCAAPTLQAGTYTEASAGYATAGNFITGADGTTLTINGEKHLVTAGTIKVAENGGTYTFDGIVKLGNGENYSFSWTGSGLAWTGLPELKKLSVVTSAQSNLASGVKSVTLNLSDGNWSSTTDMTTWQTVYTGKGNYLAIDLYSEDGYLAAGTYSPSATGGAIEKGQYGIGWDPGDIYNMGMMFENWGTCWWTVDEAATPQTSAEKITTGNITVSIDEKNVYTITVDNGELYVQFTGEIPAVTKPAAPATPPVLLGEYPYALGMTDQYEQYKSVIVQFGTTDQLKFNGMAWTGTGKVFNLTINAVKEGDNFYIPTGEYAVNPDGADQPFTWQGTGGMDLSEYGMGYMYWGTYLSDIVDGVSTVTELKEGTIWVGAKSGDYIIHINTQGKEYLVYQGKISGLTTPADDDGGYVEPEKPEGGEGEGGACGCDCEGCQDCTGGEGDGGDSGDSFKGTILSSFIHMQPGTGLVTVYLGEQPGMTYDAQTSSVSGTGNYLKFDVYSADGTTLAPGTYTPCAVAGTVTEGTFGIGWDPGDLWGIGWVFTNWGTCYMTKAADGSETGVKIEDGTITIEENGGNYVITIQSSAMSLKYEGPLA